VLVILSSGIGPGEFVVEDLPDFLCQGLGDRKPEGTGSGVVQERERQASDMQRGHADFDVSGDDDHAAGDPRCFSCR